MCCFCADMCSSQSRHYVRGSQHPPPRGAAGVSARGPFCGSWSVRPGRPRQRATGVRMTKQTPHTQTHTHTLPAPRDVVTARRPIGGGAGRGRLGPAPWTRVTGGGAVGARDVSLGCWGVCGAVRPPLHVRRVGCAAGPVGTAPAGRGEPRGRVYPRREAGAAGTEGQARDCLAGAGLVRGWGARPATPLTQSS